MEDSGNCIDAFACSGPGSSRNELCQALVEHHGYLRRVAFSILKNMHDAEDAVQAACLSAWVAFDRFRGQSSLKTWLTSIVVNKALGERKAHSSRVWISMDADPACVHDIEWRYAAAVPTQEQHVMQDESIRRIRLRMLRLPAQTRTIVDLHYFRDWSVEEIARERQATHSSVRAHLSRGRVELRRGMRVMEQHTLDRLHHHS